MDFRSTEAVERLSFGMGEAARIVGISQATLYRLVKQGELSTVKVGSRTLVTRAELERLLNRDAAS
jgi:excisionase family DNA binding protein